MSDRHINFWWDLLGKLGPPIFAGTLVACLLSGRMETSHYLLMGTGLAFIAVAHWGTFHKH